MFIGKNLLLASSLVLAAVGASAEIVDGVRQLPSYPQVTKTSLQFDKSLLLFNKASGFFCGANDWKTRASCVQSSAVSRSGVPGIRTTFSISKWSEPQTLLRNVSMVAKSSYKGFDCAENSVSPAVRAAVAQIPKMIFLVRGVSPAVEEIFCRALCRKSSTYRV